MRPLYSRDLAACARTEGEVHAVIGGITLHYDLRHPHERVYAASSVFDVADPQSDIDTLLFSRLVRTGDRVLDAGANIGHTAACLLACGAREVVAVEAEPSLYARLQRLDDRRLLPVHAAITRAAGTVRLHLSRTHNQGATLSAEIRQLFPQVFDGDTAVVEVPATTIDALYATYGGFDVWKLDIEGAEVDALTGAGDTLRQAPPRAIIAELYAPFFGPFMDALAATHPHCYRAQIRTSDYGLQLTAAASSEDAAAGCYPTSPMYVVSRAPL